MNLDSSLAITTIAKLDLGPNDVVVVTCSRRLSDSESETLAVALRDAFPKNRNKILLLPEEMTLSVVSGS